MGRRLVFFGEKPLGARALERVLAERDIDVAGVVTRKPTPDVWWGRQRVRELAIEHGIPLLGRRDVLALGRVDIVLSVLCPWVIEPEILTRATIAAVNLHQAPLPEYRGCNGASHAIIDGACTWGGTLHLMSAELDRGDIIEKRLFPVRPGVTARELYDENDDNCDAILRDNLGAIIEGRFTATPQDPRARSYLHGRDSLRDKRADLDWDDERLDRFVRGLEFPPFEPAYFVAGGAKVHLTRANWREVRAALVAKARPDVERA